MKRIIINNNEILHPIFQVLLIFGLGGFSYSIFEIFKIELQEIPQFVFSISLLYLIYAITTISNKVVINKNQIINGIYINPFGFIKKKRCIYISDILSIQISQNKDLYFEIIAKLKEDKSFVLTSIPNRIPAEEELKRIQEKIQNFKI